MRLKHLIDDTLRTQLYSVVKTIPPVKTSNEVYVSHGFNALYGLTVRKGEIGRVSKSKPPTTNVTNCMALCEYAQTYGKAPHPRTIYFERPKPKDTGKP
jgi:hypothetical protein